MKTKIAVVLLTLMFLAGTTYAQEQRESKKVKKPAKTEKSSEMSKSSSGTDKTTKKMDNSQMDHSKMDHSRMNTPESKDATVAYTCPMHPEVKSEKPGKCPKCGMDLVKKK